MRKEEFKQNMHDLIDQLVCKIDELEAKAGEIADDAREEYQARLATLHELKDNMSSKLGDFENVADSKWDVVKDSASNFFAAISDAWKENYSRVSRAFKKGVDEVKDIYNDDNAE